MKKILSYSILFCLLLVFAPSVVAARYATVPVAIESAPFSDDSLRIVNARWQIDTMDGFVLKRMHFAHGGCLGSNQNICVIELPPDSPRRLAFTYQPRRTPTTIQARTAGALAAINGSYFDMRYHNPICYLRIGGKDLGENTPQASDSIHRKYYQYASLVLKRGRPLYRVPDSARMAEQLWIDSNIMTAGPMLILDGVVLPMRTDKTFVTQRHNRTAIGTRADGTVLLVTVDGRTKQSQGMSLSDFQTLLRFLGCRNAINLDGGGSTTMYVRSMPHGGIVNRPSDNNRFDYAGERPVSNCIIIK